MTLTYGCEYLVLESIFLMYSSIIQSSLLNPLGHRSFFFE